MITYLSVTTIRTTTTFKEEFVLMVIVSPNTVKSQECFSVV